MTAPFAGRVGGAFDQPDHPGDRGGVDDHSAALGQHGRDRIFAAEIDAFDVDGHHPVPLVRFAGDHVGGRADPGVVAENVNPAIDGERLGDHRRDLLRLADIYRKGVGGPSRFGDRGGGGLGGLGVQVGSEDARAFAGEQPGHRLADARSRAGNHGHAVL